MNKGLTLIEMIVAVAIISLLSVLFLFSYGSNRRQVELSNSAEQIVSILNNAKSKSIASENASTWGVHFEQTNYTLFQGDDFTTSTNQVNYALPSNITLAHNFAIGSDIVFAKVTGHPDQTGSITLYLSGSSKNKTVCTNQVGTIEISDNCPVAT